MGEHKNKNSAARIKANNKWTSQNYDRINIAVPKGDKEKYQMHAMSLGESLNAFANRALSEAMERDNANKAE